jgi:alpha-amylase
MSSFFSTVAPLRVLLVSCLAGWALGATKEEWRNRSIYQIMTDRFAWPNGTTPSYCDQANGTYCGGSWEGIQDNLDYIQGMGFDAIWMSPIVAQMPEWTSDGMAYAGYWQQNLYEINSAFGNETALENLITEIHARGMFFMMDIVVNHMAFDGKPDEIEYQIFQPFNDEKYYHPYCAAKYDDHDLTNSEMCWMGSLNVPLADLDTGDPVVQQLFAMWIRTMIWRWGVDGLRIDAGINVEPQFFPSFMEAADIFGTAEVYTAYDDIACQWEEPVGSILNYPLYWKITDAFSSSNGNMSGLSGMFDSERSNCKDPLIFGTFSEVCYNHV